MADTVETAPTPPETTPAPAPAAPISATADAAIRGDFSAFEKADTAARKGQPLPDVAPKPVEHQLSKRQQAMNEAAARAAENATATLREENARLKAEIEGRSRSAPVSEPAQRPAPLPQPAPAGATLEQVIRRPDVSRPLLTEAEFFAQFPDAYYGAHARYASNYDRLAEQVELHQRSEAEMVQSAQREQTQHLVEQLQAAKEADPEFVTALSDQVKHQLKPFAALQPGEAAGPINVIGEQVYMSDIAPAMLKYFSTESGKADLERITTIPPSIAKLPAALRSSSHITWMIREYGKLEARVQGESPTSAAESAPVPQTTTALAPPPPTVSKARSTADPMKSALSRGDFAAFEKADLAERLRKRSGA